MIGHSDKSPIERQELIEMAKLLEEGKLSQTLEETLKFLKNVKEP